MEMEPQYEEYEKNIKREHKFGVTPKYETEFSTNLTADEFVAIAQKTIEALGWNLVYKDDKTIEAKRRDDNDDGKWTEAVTSTIEDGRIKITSVSLSNEIWDLGRNSKRVKLFVYAFNEIEKTFNKEDLKALVKETEARDNWDDYVIPHTLPQPVKLVEPKFYIAVAGGVVLSIVLALLLAKILISGVYIIGIFEFVVGLAIGFAFKYLIKISNYTNFDKLQYLLMLVIGLTYLLNQYFQYELVLLQNYYYNFSFIDFIKLRLEQGLTIKELNTGWIGLVISWILQLVLTYYTATMAVIKNVIEFQLGRVPPEVVDFAAYHFIKNKTEEQVRKELALKGWTETQHQDEVMEALSALQTSNELARLK